MPFEVGVSCHILYSSISYLYVSCGEKITSVGEERANLSAIVYLKLCGFCKDRSPFLLVLGMSCITLFWHSLGL